MRSQSVIRHASNAKCCCCRMPRANPRDIRPRISFIAGYASCFGDESLVQGEFCLDCVMQRIGLHFYPFVSGASLKERAARCGRCAMVIGRGDFELQEAVLFRLPAIDSTIDKTPLIVESVICQHCIKECFGEFLEIRWLPNFLNKQPKTKPFWAWQSYQLEQGWKEAQLRLPSP